MGTHLHNGALISSALLVSFALGCSDSNQTVTAPTDPQPARATVGGPDLVLTALSIDAWDGTLITYSWTIMNIGDAPANLDGPTGDEFDNVSVQAYLSMNLVFNDAGDVAAGGTVVGLSPLGNLNPGESRSGSFQSGIAGGADICDYAYLILKCDWGNVVTEFNEDNNTRAVLVGCGTPDLVLTSFTLDSFTSNSVSYSWTMKNIGSGTAHLEGPTSATNDNVSVQAMLSNDTIFNNAGDIPAGGTVVGSSPIADLDPDFSLSGSFGSSVAEDPCNFKYLILKCDWGEVVAELDEDNNTASTAILCVTIDIKPDSDTNPINPKSKGVIPVVVFGSENFDVSDIDISSLAFGPNGAPEAHGKGHPAGDINNDGYPDLMLHFRTQDSGIKMGDTEACVSGNLTGGGSFTACDHIQTVPLQQVGP